MMIRRWRRGLLLVPVAAAVVAGALLATEPWTGEEAVQEVVAGTVEHRLCDVVVEAPLSAVVPGQTERLVVSRSVALWGEVAAEVEASGRVQIGELRAPLEASFLVQVEGPTDSGVAVDPVTGTLLAEHYGTPNHQATLQETLDTLRVAPLDPATAPWPYTETSQVPGQVVKHGVFTYRPPDPASGLVVSVRMGTRIHGEWGAAGAVHTLILANCRSLEMRRVVAFTGEEEEPAGSIHPDDEAAFQAFFDQAEVGKLPG